MLLWQQQLKKYLLECSVVKPLHVIKEVQKSFALVHFASEADAATFYHIYCREKNPTMLISHFNPVFKSKFEVQPRFASSTGVFCRCLRSKNALSIPDESDVDVEHAK
ncbi:hypothetical protein INT43_006174, partial [Umbelopsis isabellina]